MPSSRPLTAYNAKRNFGVTPEPRGRVLPSAGPLRYYIQRHAARRLHYDFRLELAGALKSWAVPKGPSLDPAEKRLAVHVEDHPVDYGEFEGVIPEKQYGAGEVLLWDTGVWSPVGDPEAGLAKGKLEFWLDGAKLHGLWKLVRMGRDSENWLLMKGRDDYAATGEDAEIVVLRPESVKTAGREALAPDGLSPKERAARGAAGASAKAKGATKKAAGKAATRNSATKSAAKKGARKGGAAALPPFSAPQLATLVDQVPTGDEWIFEVKYDGYRMLARVQGGHASLFSRNGRDWSAKLPHLVRALEALELPDTWLDGEIVVMKEDGTTSFQALQNALDRGGPEIVFYVFDVLHHDGRDLTRLPLAERKQALDDIVPESMTGGLVRRSLHIGGQGGAALTQACRLGLEGLIGKRVDATYVSGRSRSWIKLKCQKRQEFVIGGYTEGARSGFGALLVGTYAEDGKLDYAGRVGTGFDDATIAKLKKRFAPLETGASPFRKKVPGSRGSNVIRWLRPSLVAEVSYTEVTDEGVLRHPSFEGLREDKDARMVRPERAAPVDEVTGSSVAGVAITHPDRVLFNALGVTKLELARYHEAVAEWMVPHLAKRPLSLVRCPQGAEAQCFFQKHMDDTAPAALEKIRAGSERREYLMANTPEAIVSLVQRGVIEMHTWGSRAPKLLLPDRITMDLDPDPAVSWATLLEAASVTRGLLEELGLRSFVKTTGGKGLHVVAPITPKGDWEDVKNFTRALAVLLARTFPDRFTATVTKARRTNKIYMDYLRNAEGATAIAAFSVRARGGAPVSVPLAWEELDPKHDVREGYFNVRNVPGRLRALKHDPWADYAKTKQSITQAMRKRVGAY